MCVCMCVSAMSVCVCESHTQGTLSVEHIHTLSLGECVSVCHSHSEWTHCGAQCAVYTVCVHTHTHTYTHSHVYSHRPSLSSSA